MTCKRFVLTTIVVSACSRDAVSPPVVTPDTRAMPATTAAACTKHWAKPVNGSWTDGLRWAPVGIPMSSDVVCIDAAGRYVVTLNVAGAKVQELVVGDDASQVQLSLAPASQLEVVGSFRVAAKATLDVQACPLPFAFSTARVIVDGTLRTSGQCTAMIFSMQSLRNSGLLDLSVPAQLFLLGADVQNSGTIQVGAASDIDLTRGTNFRMTAGTIRGTAALSILGNWATRNANVFNWNGGTLTEQSPGGPGVVRLLGIDLHLNASTLQGTVDMVDWGAGSTLEGDIGPNVRVNASIENGNPFTLSSGTTLPLVVNGILELAKGPTVSNAVYTAPTGMINADSVVVHAGPVTLQLDSLVNDGVIAIDDTLYAGSFGSLVRNRGTITVNGGMLKLVGTTLASAGRITGPTWFANTAVTGSGGVGRATVIASTVSPGDLTSPFASLDFDSLSLDAQSTVTVDVGGTQPASYDQLVLNGASTIGGTLNIRTNAAFPGGSCGQSLTIMPVGSGGSLSGQFANTLGTNPSPGHAWRLARTPTAGVLVGFHPTLPISQSVNALATTEGGALQPLSLCLKSVPTSTVTIALSTGLAQVTATPALFSVTPTSWELPLTANVMAVDDATVEPTVVDTVLFTVTSNDPTYGGVAIQPIPTSVIDNDGNADLALSIVVPPPPLTVGATFPVTFRGTNNGPTLSTGATFTVPMPTGFKFVSASGATCGTGPSGLSCHVPSTVSGGFVDFVIVAQAKAVGSFAIAMQLTGDQPDANSANNILLRTLVVH